MTIKNQVIQTQIERIYQIDGYTLQLTNREASKLLAVLYELVDDDQMDEIRYALEEAGVQHEFQTKTIPGSYLRRKLVPKRLTK